MAAQGTSTNAATATQLSSAVRIRPVTPSQSASGQRKSFSAIVRPEAAAARTGASLYFHVQATASNNSPSTEPNSIVSRAKGERSASG
jgi:hypothetical protein